jgi:undecaprenyl-diphosphatase
VDSLQAAVLGVVQGLTEYLPVSSSAHLAIVPWALGWPKASFAFDVLVQLGTLIGVVYYYRTDLRDVVVSALRCLRARAPLAEPDARLFWYVALATIPAVVIGLLAKDAIEAAWQSIARVFVELSITGVLLIGAEAVARRRVLDRDVDGKRALAIGFWQAFAILPGISRSGATIAGAVMMGVERKRAARFSFLMSIPVMLGAGVLAADDLVATPGWESELGSIGVGFVAAALSGYIGIAFMFRLLAHKNALYWMGAYCVAVGAAGVALSR